MADKKLQIKQYVGNNTWDNYYPKTTIAQVVGLSTELSAKQLKSNIVTSTNDWSSTLSDEKYPSEKLVKQSLDDVMEVAEGKTKTYVTGLYNGQYLAFGSSELTIGSSPTINVNHCVEITDTTDMEDLGTSDTYLYLFDETGLVLTGNVLLENLKTGDVLYIIDTDVPDFWFAFPYIYKMETTKVDLEDYATNSYVQSQFLTGVSYNSTSKKIQYTKNGSTTDIVALAAVATSGSYSDLSGTPTIPTKSSWNYDDVYVKYNASQSLDSTQKAQARSNIGAGTSNFTGYSANNKLDSAYITNNAGWTTNTGTVTSVGISVPKGLSVSGSPITTSGTLAISLATGYSIVYAGTSAPSNPYTNQIWFDTTQ